MQAPRPDRLDSWKEIAAYLERSVRTARRWEAEEGLPVHRHMHRALGSVYAYREEIDRWLHSGPRRQPRDTRERADEAPTPRAPALAVLPFTNLSPNPADEYFADGLTGEVIADLSKLRALRVTSLTSSMALRGTSATARTIARRLGVQYILEGTVRRAGERLRITAQLIDARADAQLWAGKYNGTVDDVFAMQEGIARVIVDALELRLTPDEDRRMAERPITDVRAYECYLQARQAALRWRPDAIDDAVRLLRNGLAIVGENASLYAALGRTHLYYREAGLDFGERPLEQAEACVRRAFALDAESTPALQVRGWLHYSRGQIQDAVRDLKAALDAAPNDPDTLGLLSNCYLISGHVPRARPLIERLVSVDPLTPLTRCLPGWADILEGQLPRALGAYRQMFEMDPGNPMARLFYAWVLALNGDKRAVRGVAEGFPPEMRDSLPARIASAFARALAGRRAQARAILNAGIDTGAAGNDLFPRFLAHAWALAGDEDAALRWLELAVERGFINYPFLAQHDPTLQTLRRRPAFRRLLGSVRRRWERFEP